MWELRLKVTQLVQSRTEMGKQLTPPQNATLHRSGPLLGSRKVLILEDRFLYSHSPSPFLSLYWDVGARRQYSSFQFLLKTCPKPLSGFSCWEASGGQHGNLRLSSSCLKAQRRTSWNPSVLGLLPLTWAHRGPAGGVRVESISQAGGSQTLSFFHLFYWVAGPSEHCFCSLRKFYPPVMLLNYASGREDFVLYQNSSVGWEYRRGAGLDLSS